MLIVLGFVLSALFFSALGFVFGKKAGSSVGNQGTPDVPKGKTPEYSRRGIYSNSYSAGVYPNKKSFDVQFELGELESTSTKSKVVVISMACSRSEYNDDATKKRIGEMINYTWMQSDEIEWIDDTSKMRNDKIDQILNS